MSPRRPIVRALALATLLAAVVALVACAASRERRGTPEASGFLRNYDQLKPNENFPAAEVYVNPRAQWSSYDSVQIDSVGL